MFKFIMSKYRKLNQFLANHPVWLILFMIIQGINYYNSGYYSFSFLAFGLVSLSIIAIVVNKYSKDKYDSLFGFTIFIVLTFTIITYIIVYISKNDINPFFKVGTADGWLSFAGSILGSSIMLIALIITIRDNENARTTDEDKERKRNAFNSSPIFDIEVNLAIPNEYQTLHLIENKLEIDNSYPIQVSINIKNVSHHTARNINIRSFQISIGLWRSYIEGAELIKYQECSKVINELFLGRKFFPAGFNESISFSLPQVLLVSDLIAINSIIDYTNYDESASFTLSVGNHINYKYKVSKSKNSTKNKESIDIINNETSRYFEDITVRPVNEKD